MPIQQDRRDPARSTGHHRSLAGLNGDRLAQHFGIEASAKATVSRPAHGDIVLTRLQGPVTHGTTLQLPNQEPAYSIVLQLRPLAHHELSLDGRRRFRGVVPIGAVSAISLEDNPRSSMEGYFDALQFYIPQKTIGAFAEDEGLRAPSGLLWPRDTIDPVAATLGELLLPSLTVPDPGASMFVEHVTLAFLAHAAQAYGQIGAVPRRRAAGLAPWQERRAKEMMRARLATSLLMTDVSRECRLSPGYFAMAFKRSTGWSPHRYLSELRLSQAKNLMITTKLSLSDIAALCGFGDQSYFTRVFARLVGVSPGLWRRTYRS